jgi:hypothetical protein
VSARRDRGRRIAGIQHTELQFANRDERKRHSFLKFRGGTADFSRDEDRRVQLSVLGTS